MASVKVIKLTKAFQGEKNRPIVAVDNVSFEVEDREFVVLVGPSGCGKSTILRMIAGLEEISAGEIHIGDRLVNNVPPRDRDIAMVFQNYALYPHMSVYDNLAFGLKLRRCPKAEIGKRVGDAAAILGIEHLLERKPKALSGGQRQRVAVGRAIVRQPAVFLFDEPLSNLDAKMRAQMRTEITKLHQRLEATMIYVTHDQIEAMSMGDRIVVLNNGAVQQIDTPVALYNKPANLFVAGFLGTPPMNFIDGCLKREGQTMTFYQSPPGTIRVGGEAKEWPVGEVPGKPVVLGIRPENITLAESADSEAPDRVFSAVIDMIEPMGSDTNIYLQTGGGTIVARSHRILGHRDRGQSVGCVIDLAKIHLFDQESKERII